MVVVMVSILVVMLLLMRFGPGIPSKRKSDRPRNEESSKSPSTQFVCPVNGTHEFPSTLIYYHTFGRLALRRQCLHCGKYQQMEPLLQEEDRIVFLMDLTKCSREEAYWLQSEHLRSSNWRPLLSDIIDCLGTVQREIADRKNDHKKLTMKCEQILKGKETE